MIKSKQDLKYYMSKDNDYLIPIRDKKCNFIMKKVHNEEYHIKRFLKFLRKQEYYTNVHKNKIYSLLAFYYERRKNDVGNMLGYYIAPNCFDEGLTIYHQGTIIVNPNSKIGKNCKLHGNNCIGNNGKTNDCPVIGNNVDIGFGAVLLGGIEIADDVKIGANAVVTKSCLVKGATLVGVPAKMVEKK